MAKKPRFLFKTLSNHLAKKQITLLMGARQTGKTTLLRQLEKELVDNNTPAFFVNLENKHILDLLNSNPANLFHVISPLDADKRTFVLIDEVQYLDNPSNFLKYLYDEYQERIKFVVTGSSGFYLDTKFKDSLAGRKRIFYLPTMEFKEFLYFKDREDLMQHVHTGSIPEIYKNELQSLLSEYLIFGGYPDVVLEASVEEKREILKELAESYVKKDALEASIRYPDAYMEIMKLLASQIGNLLNTGNIGKHLKIDDETVESYIRLMRRSFHISLVNPFYRSVTTELRKMKKVYFNDLGLRNYFVKDFKPIMLREDRGFLLENYVFKTIASKGQETNYWRTQKKQEVDFVVQGTRAFEVKFNHNSFESNKYSFFRKKYPKISLQFVHFDNVLTIDFENLLQEK